MKIALLAFSLALTGGFVVQDRAKKATADDVPKLLQSAAKAFDGKRYAACARDLRAAQGLLGKLVRQQILATMPAPPAGFEAEPDAQQDNSDHAIVAMMGMNVVPSERRYRKTEGDGSLRIGVTPDSLLAAMLTMGFNMAALDKSAEVVTYKDNKGLLRKEGERVTLQILIAGKDLIDVEASGMDEDALLKVVDQAFVDRVIAALTQ